MAAGESQRPARGHAQLPQLTTSVAYEGQAPLPHLATSITLVRTEGQVFRERMGFLILCVIGAYCGMQLLVELKSILEPLIWAVFLVMAGKPVVDSLERRLDWVLTLGCCWLRSYATGEVASSGYGRDVTELDPLDDLEDGYSERQRMLGEPGEDFEDLVAIGKAQHEGEDLDMGRGGVASRRARRATGGGRAHCQDIDGDDYVDESLDGRRLRWRLAIARSLAVLLVLGMTLGILSGFGFLILESARHMRNHWDVYQKGVQNLTSEAIRILGYLFQKLPESMRARYEAVTADVLKTTQDYMYSLLSNFVNNVSSLLFMGLLTILYTLFWLCSPVPVNTSIDVMFRRYIVFKTMTCLGFGVCVGILLAFLSVDLASVFALITAALNIVPEVGPFIAMTLPCPVILLDSRLERPFLVLITALLGQLALKFAFSNIIEVKLIESDKKLRMHPVMILLSVGIFGYLWGPTGMLLSVPLMALMKISLFSDLVPSSYRDAILIILEGDRNAPMRHGLWPSAAPVTPPARQRRRARGDGVPPSP